MIHSRDRVVAALSELIAQEHMIEKLLERASRAPDDPRAVAWLWNQATECRDHARILFRHRQLLDRHAPSIPYPRWRRGRGPGPEQALEQARDLAATLAGQYDRGGRTETDPYLRKFLQILSEEHGSRCHELSGILAGKNVFDEVDEVEVAD